MCRKKMMPVMTKLSPINSREYAKRYESRGNISAKVSDASDTNREMRNTEYHMMRLKIATVGINASVPPIEVATLFPPRNRKNIEKL